MGVHKSQQAYISTRKISGSMPTEYSQYYSDDELPDVAARGADGPPERQTSNTPRLDALLDPLDEPPAPSSEPPQRFWYPRTAAAAEKAGRIEEAIDAAASWVWPNVGDLAESFRAMVTEAPDVDRKELAEAWVISVAHQLWAEIMPAYVPFPKHFRS